MLEIAGGLVIGLLVGSFLNVVIYRLPIMLERSWREECQELLASQPAAAGSAVATAAERQARFNLLVPRSACPGCGAPITAIQNIPVISWIFLRGRCAACRQPIPARYPAIELLTGLLSGVVIWHFGWNPAGWVVLPFLWTLIALTFIDIDHQLLPDDLTYPLLWAGLGLSALNSAGLLPAALPLPEPEASVFGAIAGYLSLWSVYQVFRLVTGKEGMGYGDFKLLAALGAWLGYGMLPLVIMLSAVVGAVAGIAMIVSLGRDRQIPIPFGPYLAGAGFIAMLWGETIVAAYLSFSGLA
ncbi:MAG: A24 family peptidase [Gammaproteobacteria bacterium]|jgi:leader peptidase (prepilin peptidase)/N-methyltransferase|nr:A24 family peptidase [Gammaproteobacteria bacterium]